MASHTPEQKRWIGVNPPPLKIKEKAKLSARELRYRRRELRKTKTLAKRNLTVYSFLADILAKRDLSTWPCPIVGAVDCQCWLGESQVLEERYRSCANNPTHASCCRCWRGEEVDEADSSHVHDSDRLRKLKICAHNALHKMSCRCYAGEAVLLTEFCGKDGHLFNCRCSSGAPAILQSKYAKCLLDSSGGPVILRSKYMKCLLDIEHHKFCECYIGSEVVPSAYSFF